MGRTRRTLRDQFDALEREWSTFRRALRRAHQPAFDKLFDRARSHADAAGQQNAPDRWQSFAVCVLLAQERALAEQEEAIAQQRDEIEALRERIETLEAGGSASTDSTGGATGAE